MSDFLEIQDKDLNLNKLDSFFNYNETEKHRRKQNYDMILKEQEEFKKRYGLDWAQHWIQYRNPTPDYDCEMKWINESIYDGCVYRISGSRETVHSLYERVEQRMREIYGDKYDILKHHEPNNPFVNEFLIEDAIKTGKWKELPDCLQAAYHKRIKNETDINRV